MCASAVLGGASQALRVSLVLLLLAVTMAGAQAGPSYKHYLAFCCVFKDEAEYLAEWIAFHELVGVSHFYLYSNESKDKYRSVLAPFESAGLVTLHEWPTRQHGKQASTQCDAYKHCLAEHGPSARWMGFFDVDEFLYPQAPDAVSLEPVLRRFEQYGGLVVRSAMYGSSGYINRPEGLVSENYAFRALILEPTFAEDEDDVLFHVKSIVDARHGIGCGRFGAHVIFFDDPEKYYLVNERGERHRTEGKNAPKGHAAVDLIRYNHYKCKSRADWTEKRSKGTVQGASADKKFAKRGNLWENVDRNDVLDESIHRFLPALREKLGLRIDEYAQG